MYLDAMIDQVCESMTCEDAEKSGHVTRTFFSCEISPSRGVIEAEE